MRYIRTKRFIYDLDKYKIVKRMHDGVYYRNSIGEVWCVIYTENIVKESDDIEELFDDKVKVFDDGTRIICPDISTKTGHYILHGAIWTEIGLIYVAKMNEEGDWKVL